MSEHPDTLLPAVTHDGPIISIKVKRELFRFNSRQEWINTAQRRYANCGVRSGHYITVDSAGHIMYMGRCFAEADRLGLYPVTVYELQDNHYSDQP